MGIITDTLRATLRDLAESDARLYRGIGEQLDQVKPEISDEISAAIALLESHGYKVSR